MRTSYHVHSNLSDGQAPINVVVKEAVRIGLDELGMSDHFVFPPEGKVIDWSMPISALPDYFAKISDAEREVHGKLTIRRGLEADYIPETAGSLSRILNDFSLDYIIGSVHFIGDFCVDERKDFWDVLTETEHNTMIRTYWRRIRQMADSRLFDIAGHLDLYKKFGYLPTVDVSQDISSALDAIAAADMAVELNTAGWYKEDICEAYPSQAIIQGCYDRGIPMLVTSDAHKPEDLVRGYDRGIRWLLDAGYTQQAVFARRQRRMVDLPR